jgi:regulator of replication initiation timing
MSKELIDRIQELLLIVSAQRDEIKELKKEVKDLVEEIAEMRLILDNHEY